MSIARRDMHPDDFASIEKDISGAHGSLVEYGKAKGDVGSEDTFLDFKFGDFRRLNPPMWEILFPNSPISHELFGVSLDFLREYTGTLRVKNLYSCDTDIELARKVFH